MSAIATNRLIRRLRRTTVGGKGFQVVISDLMRMCATGDISSKECKAIQKAADEQLRKFNRELIKQRAALRGY